MSNMSRLTGYLMIEKSKLVMGDRIFDSCKSNRELEKVKSKWNKVD